MSIRPVDLQVTFNKTPEVGKMQTNEIQRPETIQQQVSEELRRDTIRSEQSVVETNKTDESSVDKDGKGNGEAMSKRRRSRDDKKQENKEEQKAGLFDVSI